MAVSFDRPDLLSPAESLDVWQARVSADFDVVLLAQTNGLLHDERISGVEAACYVCMVDQRNELFVRSLK